MTTSEDIEKAIAILQSQFDNAVQIRDEYKGYLDAAEGRVKYFRDAIQGLRKMEIERERK